MAYTVYMLVSPLDKKPFYIGITERDDPEIRRQEHIQDIAESVKQRHIAEILRAGKEPFMVYLDVAADAAAARDAERAWQEFLYAQGFTLTNGEICKLNTQMERRSGTRWTDEEIEQLKALYREKHGSFYEIAQATERTPEAIKMLIERMLYLFLIEGGYEIREQLKAMEFKFDKKLGWHKREFMPEAGNLIEKLKSMNIKFKMMPPKGKGQ